MDITTSSLLEYYFKHPTFYFYRYEVLSYNFKKLRYNLIQIIKIFNELDESSKDIANDLRTLLSEWLTVPVIFDEEIVKAISIIGEPANVEKRWGHDLNLYYQASLDAAIKLIQKENPIRSSIYTVLEELSKQKNKIRIYCHKLARPYFESIIHSLPDELPENDNLFIHSNKQYREMNICDILLKVGPLRSRGWGGCPDAILTAPRFEKLIQFVWASSKDELGFGLDPVTGISCIEGGDESKSVFVNNATAKKITWNSSIIKVDDNDKTNEPLYDIEDEFQVFQTIIYSQERRKALHLQINNEHGMLYPARTKILSFDNTTKNKSIDLRVVGSTFTEGMFIILPILNDDIDLGILHADEGKYSQIWKERLIKDFEADRDYLCSRLYHAGIELLCIQSRVKDWCKPATTVIPAPRKVQHFKTLIEILDITSDDNDLGQKNNSSWWKNAWREIQRSRGEAISEGRVSQEILDEEINEILNDLEISIRNNSQRKNDFEINMPPTRELSGKFRFCKVLSIEEGFHAPDSALKIISDIREFEQWRD